jgi:general secretion pathway protein E
MVGEIRDRETAEIAMAAAITGHLVLSTIHTPDAPSALDRLAQMGVPRFLIAGGLAGVVAQRLVRTVCAECGGRGCPRCIDGYRGRSGVFEVLIMNDRIREEIVRGTSPAVLRQLAVEGGMTPMLDDARRKVADRVTSPHEVARVLRDDPGSVSACRSCGAAVPYEALGCPACGARQHRVCACSKRLRPDWRFCPWCLRPGPS